MARGIVGAYPNAFFAVEEADLGTFTAAVLSQTNEASYDELRDRFGVRRTAATFWAELDALHDHVSTTQPIRGSLFDLNRLENR